MIDFSEVIAKNSYEMEPTNIDAVSLMEGSYQFENLDRSKLKKLESREKLKEFRLINLDFLEMQTKENYPCFAVFTTHHPICEIAGESSRWGTKYGTNFKSKCIRLCYLNFFKFFMNKALEKVAYLGEYDGIEMRLTSKFNGILPKHAREDIAKNEKKFDEIVIIAEADNWTFKSEKINLAPNPDPLIVGIKDDLAYLISTFDISKLEDYVKREFTDEAIR